MSETHAQGGDAGVRAGPDALIELRHLYRAYVSLLEIGRDRIIGLGGTCDPVDVMEAGDPALRRARAAIERLATPPHGGSDE